MRSIRKSGKFGESPTNFADGVVEAAIKFPLQIMSASSLTEKRSFFRPKLIECLYGYTSAQFIADLIAGLTVGIVALPLAMAFAIASGVKPEAGIFTAVIAGFIISALGGSRVQIGGPTGAFIVIVFGILAKYGAANLAICTIMAGIMLFVMGLTGMGAMIKFIPYPVTMGFTSGIAVLIFSTQIKDFFGLEVDKVPAEFVEKLKVLAEHFGSLQWPTVALALASLLIIVLWPKRWARRVPGSIVALVFGTALVMILQIPVETIGSDSAEFRRACRVCNGPISRGRTSSTFFRRR